MIPREFQGGQREVAQCSLEELFSDAPADIFFEGGGRGTAVLRASCPLPLGVRGAPEGAIYQVFRLTPFGWVSGVQHRYWKPPAAVRRGHFQSECASPNQ